ncbi:MAG: arylsulfatase, partial [Lentisphaeraceae bacterium]|nr:arylsulfatase [Lentisphaeraceae bacterium]
MACLLPCFASQQSTNAKPNIVYFLVDDMGYGDLKCHNADSKINTPHLDALAAQGMVFSDAHSPSSVCTPTRYGILTGRYAWRTWLKKSVIGGASAPLIKPHRETAASLLKKNGYKTALIGKWHLGWDFHFHADSVKLDPLYWGFTEGTKIDFAKGVKNGPDVNGFDYYYALASSLDIPPYIYVENGRVTNLDINIKDGEGGKRLWRRGPVAADFEHQQVTPNFVKRACHYIEKQSDDKPFFLYLSLPSPHTPILPTKAFHGKSKLNEYGDFVMQIDSHVGQVIETLKKQGLYKNTLFIFTADNGTSPRADIPELMAKGHDPSGALRGRKADIFEGGHRVPYIVSWPKGGVKPGSVCDAAVCLTDLIATCAEIVGTQLSAAAGVDSVSNLPLLRGQTRLQKREAIVHHSINGSFAIRQG